MSDKFRLVMNAVDEDLLEEAMMPVKKNNLRRWVSVAAAACLLLVLGMPMAQKYQSVVTFSELSDMGYDLKIPEEAKKVRYALDGDEAQVSFEVQDTAYVYRALKTQEPQLLSDEALSWNAENLELQLLASSTGTSVSWYTEENQTQWYLTGEGDALEVLTTASQILRAIGLDVTVAPENAENITYNAFLLDGLTVAETTFMIDGITYRYRMAPTMEIREDFADISGMADTFGQESAGEVRWCSARVACNAEGQGKIIWFDVAPGILYSLSMDKCANETALLDIAHRLFEPAQENS